MFVRDINFAILDAEDSNKFDSWILNAGLCELLYYVDEIPRLPCFRESEKKIDIFISFYGEIGSIGVMAFCVDITKMNSAKI